MQRLMSQINWMKVRSLQLTSGGRLQAARRFNHAIIVEIEGFSPRDRTRRSDLNSTTPYALGSAT